MYATYLPRNMVYCPNCGLEKSPNKAFCRAECAAEYKEGKRAFAYSPVSGKPRRRTTNTEGK